MSNTLSLLGHTFRPMEKSDWDAFAGADDDSFICYLDEVTLIWSPSKNALYEITADGHEREWNLR